MATAATAARPMPVGAQDFNDILEEKIVFPNAEGKNQEITFHEAVLSANAVAEALQKRVISRIDHFSISDKTQIAAEYRALKDQYDSLEGLAYRTQEVADAFKSMLPQYDAKLDQPNATDKKIHNKAEAEGLVKFFSSFIPLLKSCYLMSGGMLSYRLPDYLEQMRLMIPQQRV